MAASTDPLHVPVPAELRAELRRECAAELTTPAGGEMIAALGGETVALERFLVARGLKTSQAAQMLRDTLAFRSDEIARVLPIDPTIVERIMPLWPVAYRGRSADGHPMQLARAGECDPKAILHAASEDEFRAFYIHWVEVSLRHQAACGNKKLLEIHDLKGCSLAQVHVPALRVLARTLKIGQDHYMESLHRCVIINAPRVFALAWSIISSVLHERTRAKTLILSGDGVDTLVEVTGLDREQVMAILASDLDEDPLGERWLAGGTGDPPKSAQPAQALESEGGGGGGGGATIAVEVL